MWLYAFCATAFLHLTNAILEQHNAHEEAMFADVIRNISRVNNVLQDLIKNYEQLQKIYKSKENTEGDYSSDTEIDEVFKSMQKAKMDHKKNAKFNPTDRPTYAASFPATQMFWPDDDNDENSAEVSHVTNKKLQTKKAKIIPKPESLQGKQNEPKDDTFETTSSELKEMIRNTSFSKPKEAEIIFIDTHKQIEAINDNKNVSPFKMKNIIKKPKTRYNKIFKNYKANMKTGEKPNIKQSSDTKVIKKVIYMETFSPKNIWKEIIKNKPIKLEPQKAVTYLNPQNRAANNFKNEVQPDEKDTFESPEDQTIAKEIFKTNVLRHAYGDACTKVVVKKCYKACRRAGKSFCTLYKCNSAFKSKFKELSKTGCLREFIGPNSSKSDVQYRGQDDVFTDATRGRFFDAACLPHAEPMILRNTPTAFKTIPISKHDKTINILRDKYERACKKVSVQKCTSACNYAYTNTCDTFKCVKNKRKNFKKYCKQQCKIIYKVYSDSESSYTDSSSMNSDDSSTSY